MLTTFSLSTLGWLRAGILSQWRIYNDQRHVLIRPILQMKLEDLLPALNRLTVGSAIWADGIWRVKISGTPDPDKPG